jgi:crotonobetainyl-CoA:carnitine CoA-transferase CaiB-like acyl-CoA transferase
MSQAICSGQSVLELGSGSIAGSLAGMILTDNGARVVNVEPCDGDALRRTLPSGFLVWKRGKESVVHDLRDASAPAGVRALAKRADLQRRLSGNICRGNGYQAIIGAAQRAASATRA